ncbi:hypothetical protein B0H34DRAFT_674082 [Crassisporium funariophilum]|nr:hypothetical protein B0H34DRAFT_674082 [Crassisporium funariophilum]
MVPILHLTALLLSACGPCSFPSFANLAWDWVTGWANFKFYIPIPQRWVAGFHLFPHASGHVPLPSNEGFGPAVFLNNAVKHADKQCGQLTMYDMDTNAVNKVLDNAVDSAVDNVVNNAFGNTIDNVVDNEVDDADNKTMQTQLGHITITPTRQNPNPQQQSRYLGTHLKCQTYSDEVCNT